MKSFTAGKNDAGVRLSRFVESVTSNMPSSMMYKAFRNKRIKINGKKAAADYRLAEGDLIELYINDEFFSAEKAKPSAKPAKKTFRPQIIFEDENLCVMYKPPHILCHSDRTGDPDLISAYIDTLAQRGEYDASSENTFRPSLCNRLDRGTEGLIVAAKNYAALRDMNEAIRIDLITKKYLTITYGVPQKGRHIAYLKHFEKDNKVAVRSSPAQDYKQIITDVEILNTKGPYALNEITLVTGRTHQIRAHLSFLKAPVLGDIKYGNRQLNEKLGLKTQILCAQSLTFQQLPAENVLHYLSGKTIRLQQSHVEQYFDQIPER